MSSGNAVRRIHIVGRKNSGKTTLVCELVRELTARGLRVATVKHTHHRHELDTPGKDSYLHREAGAAAVGILSPRMTAMFVPSQREGRGEDRYELFESQFAGCDLILVEGDLQTTAPRIEVWRGVTGESPYANSDPAILAIVTDDRPMSGDKLIPQPNEARSVSQVSFPDLPMRTILPRSPVQSVADFVVALVSDQSRPAT